MAQQVENRLPTRLQENFPGDMQKGKAMVHGRRTTRTRSTLGDLVNKPEIAGKRAKSQEYEPCKDLVEGGVSKKLEHPRLYSVESTENSTATPKDTTIRDIDIEDINAEFSSAEYAKEINLYLKEREVVYQVPPNYIQSHAHVGERMRAILVDWLVQVNEKFRLLQETLFLTVSFLDRYLAVDTKVMKTDFQLVGVTAMLLASKIEEIYTPEIGDFVYITDNAYSPAQIRACESKMAAALQFNFGDPLCIHFLRRNSKAAKADAEKHTLAKYFMELMLPDYESLAFPPSMRAAAALCLAMKITDNSPWDATTAHFSHHQEPALLPCMKKIAKLVCKSKNKDSKLLSVTEKYKKNKYFNIATSPRLDSILIQALVQD